MVKIREFTFDKAPVDSQDRQLTAPALFLPLGPAVEMPMESLWIIKGLRQNNSLTTILDTKSWIQHSGGLPSLRTRIELYGSNLGKLLQCQESLQSSDSNPLFMWVSDAKLLFASPVRVLNVTISQSFLSSTARLWRWTPSNRRMKDKHSKWQIA